MLCVGWVCVRVLVDDCGGCGAIMCVVCALKMCDNCYSYQRLANSAALEALFFPYVFQFILYIAGLGFRV